MSREPFLPSFRHEIDRLFDTLVHTAWGGCREATPWKPACDVVEAPDRYAIELDLPGVRTADLSITAEGRTLRVEGVRQKARRRDTEYHHVMERTCGRFVRTFQLPADADPGGIHARLEEGVLTLEIPRRENRSER
ncbi:MAG: Hsp20/alpha crystallin family protein [Deferrisomatales bacterium]|nr:Hsp20/alpha crystallin family protein [Deferrisomatales bacterium]